MAFTTRILDLFLKQTRFNIVKMILRIVILFLSYLHCSIAIAQSSTIDIIGGGTGLAWYAGFSKPQMLKKSTLDYKEVEGTCFWDDKWNPAVVYTTIEGRLKLKNVRLNFYSSEVHYLDQNNEEFVLQKGVVNKIVFLNSKDTAKVTGVFQSYESAKGYLQVLKDGNTQFLKENSVALKKLDYNQFKAKDIYRFVSTKKYFIKDNGTLSEFTSISKSSVLSIIKSTDQIEEWLKSNHNKLKDEDDVVAFLEFYNSDKK